MTRQFIKSFTFTEREGTTTNKARELDDEQVNQWIDEQKKSNETFAVQQMMIGESCNIILLCSERDRSVD